MSEATFAAMIPGTIALTGKTIKLTVQSSRRARSIHWQKSPHEPANDIFEALLTRMLKDDVKLSLDILKYSASDADIASLGNPFEPHGHIDTGTEKVAVIAHDTAEIDANAELNSSLLRHIGIALRHAPRSELLDPLHMVGLRRELASSCHRSRDAASFEVVRRYQLHLAASGVGAPRVSQTISTLRFFLVHTQAP